eukprot:gnl/Spiro4/14227_TR7649_c0_g1_i1.p1 gnl/Spiro4/14227_TR7649_c0_g1~~gnl/Spiro4/14227_TR7649_c0_g1_i1.p1  ORF type:complete len:772 (+),score=193.42 gnl/Spiro4/14227_TR7649_c0_g1_i1:61-2316(+)
MVHATVEAQSTLLAHARATGQATAAASGGSSLANLDAERDSATILMSIGISFMIFFMATLIFSIIRKFRVRDGHKAARKPKREESFCYWIWELITASDQEMEDRCGSDSVVYLSFQRMVTWNTIFIAVLSVVVFLPINLSGQLNAVDFSATTSDNLPPGSPIMWTHLAMSFVFSLLIYFFIYRFSTVAKEVAETFHTTSPSSYSVLIRWFPRNVVDDEKLRQYFDSIYKDQVFDAHAIPAVEKLLGLEAELDACDRQQERLQVLATQRRAAELRVNPSLSRDRPLTYMQTRFQLPCFWTEYDALQENSEKLEALKNQIAATKAQIQTAPEGTGVACVTFRTVATARRCVEDFAIGKRPTSANHDTLCSADWQLDLAPDPSDIIWENLGVGVWNRRLRTFFLTCLMFLIVCALIIPVVILSSVDKLRSTGAPWTSHLATYAETLDDLERHVVFTYFPMMLLVFVTSWLMPMMVEYTVKMERHYYRSEAESSKMNKYFCFMLLSVLLLPGLTLGWFDTMIADDGSLNEQTDMMHLLGRVILSNSGPFFILFVLQTALVSTAFQLLRLPDFFWRKYYEFHAVTDREIEEAKNLPSHFDYSSNYPEIMCIFTIILIYSVAVPLILPFGILYFMLKHNIDKYNMYQVHERKEYASALTTTRTVIYYIFFSLAAFQLSMSGFFYVQEMRSLSVLMLIMLGVTLSMILARFLHSSLVVFPDDEVYKLHSNEPITERARGAYVCPSLRQLPLHSAGTHA